MHPYLKLTALGALAALLLILEVFH